MTKSTKSVYTHVFKNKPKKVGYYIRVTDMDSEPVFIGSTVNEGFENFEARFPESWADKQWWIEKCTLAYSVILLGIILIIVISLSKSVVESRL